MSEKNATTLIDWRILESRILDFGIHNSAQETGIQYLESIAWNTESKGVLVLHYILAKSLGLIIVHTLRRRIG